MTDTPQEHEHTSRLLADLGRLIRSLPARRKIQLALLFILQIAGALSEIASLGAIVPFLSALTDVESLMTNARIAPLLDVLDITQPQQVVVLMACIFAVAIVIANILRFTTLWVQLKISAAIGTDVGTMLFAKTLHRPYPFFVKNNSGDLIGNTTNDLNGTLGVLYGMLTLMTQGLIMLSVATGLLLYDVFVALSLSVVAAAAYTVIMLAVRGRLHRNSRIQSDSYREIIRALQEGFGGIRYITLDGTHAHFVDQYRRADARHRISFADNSIIRQAPRFFVEAVGVAAICVLTIILSARSPDISGLVPLLGFLALASHRLLPAMQQIYTAISSILGLRVSLNRVVSMLEQDTPLAQHEKPAPLHLQKTLSFENVRFGYDAADRAVLQDITLSIHAGTSVAFVGATGSGKSTLSDLVLGLIAPQGGRITIDGAPLNADNVRAWQAGIAHVPQHIFLTDESLAENIAFGTGMQDIDMDRVIAAARHAQIHDFIEALPDGYDTLAGERGVRLSGGQVQRIGIARALYTNPSLIVFDEATSALDTQTEKDVMQAIEGLGKGRTIILIAHRLSTVKKADMIFVFDQGRLAGQGKYDDLLKTSSRFRSLVQGEG